MANDSVPDERTTDSKVAPLAGALLFLGIAALIAVDATSDYRAGTDIAHLAVELAVMALALVGVGLLWRVMRRAERRAASLGVDRIRARGSPPISPGRAGRPARAWGGDRPTVPPVGIDAESEVGLLLLKGLSHREISEIRRTSEATVRQQALAIYRKAGLRGRSELAAFFLEDLLLPPSPQA